MTTKKSTEWDGRMRTLAEVLCTCGVAFWAPLHQIRKGRVKHCSRTCRDKAQVRSVAVVCGTCGAPLLRKPGAARKAVTGLFYCNRECKRQAQFLGGPQALPHYGTAEVAAYRKRAIAIHGANCVVCGYSDDARMLDVDHIDGNRRNGALDNLQVLCVWHHMAKTRGVLNPGSLPGQS